MRDALDERPSNESAMMPLQHLLFEVLAPSIIPPWRRVNINLLIFSNQHFGWSRGGGGGGCADYAAASLRALDRTLADERGAAP